VVIVVTGGQHKDDRANNVTEFQHIGGCGVMQRYSCKKIWQRKQF
jgi:hypothetical protein